MVESSSEQILKDADKTDVAFLVVGDPFGSVNKKVFFLLNVGIKS